MTLPAEAIAQVARSWQSERAPRDETTWTPGTREGVWHAWTGKGAEAEWIALAAALVACSGARCVIETGVGGGYTTRRLWEALPPDGRLVGYESADELRPIARDGLAALVSSRAPGRARIASEATPTPEAWSACEVAVLDSHTPLRIAELRAWWEHAPSGSLVVVHDVSWDHGEGTPHRQLAEAVADLHANVTGFAWVPTGNPRGGIVGHKP